MNAARSLIAAIAEHALTGQADELARFRENIAQASQALGDGVDADTVLEQMDAVVKSLAEHNRRTVWFQRFQTTELQGMVTMLTSAISVVAATGEANTQILSHIERQVAVVSDLNDVRQMKAKLSGCLANIRSEAARQRTENEKTIHELRRGLSEFQTSEAANIFASGNGMDGDSASCPNPDCGAKLATRLRPDVPLSELGRSVSIRSQPSWRPTDSRL